MNKVIYDEEHMNLIATKYNQCADTINQIISYHENVKENMVVNYEGQAMEVACELFDKLKRHISLLRICCETMEEYVRCSLEEMKQLDENL